jgi:hypothetical protein
MDKAKDNIQMLTVSQYAKIRKVSRNAIVKRLTPTILHMPGLINAQKFGQVWMLKVNVDVAKAEKIMSPGRKNKIAS